MYFLRVLNLMMLEGSYLQGPFECAKFRLKNSEGLYPSIGIKSSDKWPTKWWELKSNEGNKV